MSFLGRIVILDLIIIQYRRLVRAFRRISIMGNFQYFMAWIYLAISQFIRLIIVEDLQARDCTKNFITYGLV